MMGSSVVPVGLHGLARRQLQSGRCSSMESPLKTTFGGCSLVVGTQKFGVGCDLCFQALAGTSKRLPACALQLRGRASAAVRAWSRACRHASPASHDGRILVCLACLRVSGCSHQRHAPTLAEQQPYAYCTAIEGRIFA